jgi:hypothetical protein
VMFIRSCVMMMWFYQINDAVVIESEKVSGYDCSVKETNCEFRNNIVPYCGVNSEVIGRSASSKPGKKCVDEDCNRDDDFIAAPKKKQKFLFLSSYCYCSCFLAYF